MLGHRARRQAARTVVVTLLASVLVLFQAPPPAEAGTLLWDNASTFKTFGGNQAITIDIGTIAHTGGCPPGGFDDFFYPFADI